MQPRNLRLDLNNRVELVWNGRKTHADIGNISIGGALVAAKIPVKVGDSMSLYLAEESFPVAMEIGAEVIRKGHVRHGKPAFALKFNTIPGTLEIFMHYLLMTHRATLI